MQLVEPGTFDPVCSLRERAIRYRQVHTEGWSRAGYLQQGEAPAVPQFLHLYMVEAMRY